MAAVRFGTYNLLNLKGPTTGERYGKVVEVIQGLDVDVLAVQEILASDEQDAGKTLTALGQDVGLVGEYEPGRPAVATGHKLTAGDLYFHIGLLWKPGIEPVPGLFRALVEDFWHALAIGVFDLGGPKVAMASFHASPFGRNARADQAERVVSALTRPDTRPPGMVGADWNCIGADWRNDGSGPYDHDWHAEEPWHDALIYQCRWTTVDGVRRHWADRGPGEVLYYGGLRDAAAVLDAPWEPTVGHWPSDDPYGERRIDGIRVTSDLVPVLQEIQTERTELSLQASDHLPVVVTFDPGLITVA